MPLNPIDQKAANQVCTLVRFSWGLGPTIATYAAWTSDVVYSGQTFQAIPAIEIDYGKQDGSVQDSPATITMPLLDPITFLRLAFPEVFIEIIEIIPGDDDSARLRFYGSIAKHIRNVNGKPGVCKVTAGGIKSGLDVRLSIIIGNGCPWIFGQKPCMKDLTTIQEEGEVLTLQGQLIQLAGLTTVNVDPHWRFGSLEYDGLCLGIAGHQIGTGFLFMNRPPPLYWIGKTVLATPGCDGTLDSGQGCRHWGQEANYGAIGRKMMDRHPQFEPGDVPSVAGGG